MSDTARPAPTLDVTEFIDGAAIRGLVAYAPLLCGLLMIVEGIDTYGIGYVGPMLSKAYAIGPKALGVIYSGTVVASLFGAVVLGPFADKIGSRSMLVLSSFLLAVCTLLTPFAAGTVPLFIVRFLIGVAFGAALPSAFAITADYAPERVRSRVLMIMASGIALGVVIAGVASAYIIPAFGWKALLFTFGAVSLTIASLMAVLLPESIRFAVLRRPGSPKTQRLAARILAEQGVAPGSVTLVSSERPVGQPVLELLRHGRAPLTLVLCVAMGSVYSVEFFMSSWLPTILLSVGATVKMSGLVMAAAKLGSMSGDAVVGWAMDRRGTWRVLMLSFVGAVICVIALGLSISVAAAAFGMLIASCFFIDGAFAGVIAITASSYPVAMRATATGWVTGLARLVGGGLGSMAGGFVVAAHWSTWQTALLIAAPLSLAAGILLVGIVAGLPVRAALDKG
jgi:AAHS family 4-hydroxybenzoate transporter-like MFS transporter